MLRELLLSEAAVERSFFSQKKIFRPDRNRSQDESLNNQMFIRSNYHKIQGTTPNKHIKSHTNTILRAEWELLAVSVAVPQPDATGPAAGTRRRQKEADAKNIEIGSQLFVVWHAGKNGAPVKWRGTVVDVDGPGKYKICYRGEKKLRNFDPLGKDREWEYVT